MSIDQFSEISADRFRSFQPEQTGHKVMLFPYMNYGRDEAPRLVGLWLSDELVKKQIETAHYIPDLACSRALKKSGAYHNSGSSWLGLMVEVNDVEEIPKAKITIPEFLIEQYSFLVVDKDKFLSQELEERFCVRIVHDTAATD